MIYTLFSFFFIYLYINTHNIFLHIYPSIDTAKKFKDQNELIKENEKLMEEIKILQNKYKSVDLFFKDKVKYAESRIQ